MVSVLRRTSSERERWAEEVLDRLTPAMTALGVLFLLVVLAESLAREGSATGVALTVLGWVLWLVFAAEFAARLVVAPDTRRFLRRNWWQLLFLVLPFLRVLRVVRAVRFLRTGRVLSSAVRTSRSAHQVLGGRIGWLGVVWAITVMGSSQLLFQFSDYRKLCRRPARGGARDRHRRTARAPRRFRPDLGGGARGVLRRRLRDAGRLPRSVLPRAPRGGPRDVSGDRHAGLTGGEGDAVVRGLCRVGASHRDDGYRASGVRTGLATQPARVDGRTHRRHSDQWSAQAPLPVLPSWASLWRLHPVARGCSTANRPSAAKTAWRSSSTAAALASKSGTGRCCASSSVVAEPFFSMSSTNQSIVFCDRVRGVVDGGVGRRPPGTRRSATSSAGPASSVRGPRVRRGVAGRG